MPGLGMHGKHSGVSGPVAKVSRGAEPKVNRGRPDTTLLTSSTHLAAGLPSAANLFALAM
jgi:hypothetical protein